MSIRIGINGFGRIGRNVFRAGFNRPGIEFVAVNDLPTPTATLAHLLKYDSIHGLFNADVASKEGAIVVNGKVLKVFTAKSPAEIAISILAQIIQVRRTAPGQAPAGAAP